MNNKKPTRRQQLLISIGLLLVTTPFLINEWVHMPDSFRGLITGFGAGLEMVGLISFARRRKAIGSQCSNGSV